MASLGDALMVKLGLDLSNFKQNLDKAINASEGGADRLKNNANKATSQASANIAKINQQATSTLNNVMGLAKRLAAPVTAALSFGAMIKSYWGGMGQVASMTGAYYKQLDAWREKMAALRRYTREDLELYRRTNRSMTDFRIAMADLSAEMMRSFNPLWRVGLNALEKFTKFISEHKEDVVRFLKIIAVTITTALIPAFVKLAAAMLANPITWVIGLILALALAIDDLIVYLQGGNSLFSAFWQPCIDFCKQAWEWIKTFWETFQNTPAVQAAKDAVVSFADTALHLFNSLVDFLGLVWDGFARLIEIGEQIGFFDTLAEAATYFFGLVTNGLNTIMSLFDVIFSAIVGLVTGDFSKLGEAWAGFCNNFKALFESAKNAIYSGINAILGFITTLGNGIIELGHKIVNALDISGLIAKAKGALASFVDYLPDFMKSDDMKAWIVENKGGTPEIQYPHKRDENGQMSWTAPQALEPRLRGYEANLSKIMPTHTQLARDSMTNSVMNNIHNNGGNKNVTNNFTINSATPDMAKTAIETANDVGDNNSSVANSIMATS